MIKLSFVALVILLVLSFLVMVPGIGRVYAGGEEETIEPAKEEVVITTENTRPKLVWFVVGFLAAIFITAL